MTVDEKINKIFMGNYKAHYMLKKILSDKTLFIKNKQIKDLIFIRRESLDEHGLKSHAKLIIATEDEILIMKEGFNEIDKEALGYKMLKIYYDKITGIEFDICLLKGEFKIITNGNKDISVEFNSSKYYKEFEKFIECIHEYLI